MRLGFYTVYSEEIAQFAQETGFRSLELSAWPQTTLNADTVNDEHLAAVRRDLGDRDIEISALGYYPNYLHPDPDEAAESSRYLVRVMELAHRMEVRTVCTFAGQIPGAAVEDSLEPFAELFNRFCDRAAELGVRIAIENCPMLDHKTRRGENIAYSPEIWDAMFAAVPSPALGIELDPSHMVYLGIDYVQAVRDYGTADLPCPRQGHRYRRATPRPPRLLRAGVRPAARIRERLVALPRARLRAGRLASLHLRACRGRLRRQH